MKEQFDICKKEEYKLWIDYNLGKIKRPLTKEEKKNIWISDFALELILPTEMFKELVIDIYGSIERAKSNQKIIKKLSKMCLVEEEVIIIKLDKIIRNNELEQSRELIKKIKSDANNL